MPEHLPELCGAGLGLRRALLGPLQSMDSAAVDFMEVAPENWIGVGGRFGRQFRQLAERHPIVLHGLSLDIGGPDPIDIDLVRSVKTLMSELGAPLYSEHLTYCAAGRPPLRSVADTLYRRSRALRGRPGAAGAGHYRAAHRPGERLLLCPAAGDMSEAAFISAVLAESGCELLLDVNNIYVNSINHRYDPVEFLDALPLERTRYIHVAGHYRRGRGSQGGYPRRRRHRSGVGPAGTGLPATGPGADAAGA